MTKQGFSIGITGNLIPITGNFLRAFGPPDWIELNQAALLLEPANHPKAAASA
ncbi:MAG: hypothetical protein AAF583_14120 [Pseudomonadota bacterium]